MGTNCHFIHLPAWPLSEHDYPIPPVWQNFKGYLSCPRHPPALWLPCCIMNLTYLGHFREEREMEGKNCKEAPMLPTYASEHWASSYWFIVPEKICQTEKSVLIYYWCLPLVLDEEVKTHPCRRDCLRTSSTLESTSSFPIPVLFISHKLYWQKKKESNGF